MDTDTQIPISHIQEQKIFPPHIQHMQISHYVVLLPSVKRKHDCSDSPF